MEIIKLDSLSVLFGGMNVPYTCMNKCTIYTITLACVIELYEQVHNKHNTICIVDTIRIADIGQLIVDIDNRY